MVEKKLSKVATRRQIEQIHDRELEQAIYALHVAIQNLSRNRNKSASVVDKLERNLMTCSRRVIARYSVLATAEMSDPKNRPKHKMIQDLIRYYLDEVHSSIPRHHPTQVNVPYLMSTFETQVRELTEKFS